MNRIKALTLKDRTVPYGVVCIVAICIVVIPFLPKSPRVILENTGTLDTNSTFFPIELGKLTNQHESSIRNLIKDGKRGIIVSTENKIICILQSENIPQNAVILARIYEKNNKIIVEIKPEMPTTSQQNAGKKNPPAERTWFTN